MPEDMAGQGPLTQPNPAEGQAPVNQAEPGAAGQAGGDAQPPGGMEPAAAPDSQGQLQPGVPPEGAAPAGGEQPPAEPQTQPAEGVAAPAGDGTPEDSFMDEFLASVLPAEKEPETPEAASGRPTLPYKEIGKCIGERTREDGVEEVNFQFTTFDENGNPRKRETGWMPVKEAAFFLAHKYNAAELSFDDQKRAAQASTGAERSAGKGPEDTFFGAPDELFGAPPTERGDAPAGDGLFDVTAGTETTAGFGPVAPEQGIAPQSQQGFTIQQLALAQGEQAAFQEWLARNEMSVRQRVTKANSYIDDDGKPQWESGFTKEQYEAALEAEAHNQFEAYKKIPTGKQQVQQHARQQMQLIQEQFAQDDASAEMALGRYAPNLLPAMQGFAQRVVVQGQPPRTPEEAFLARNANFTNPRLLTALALHALKLGRELPQKLEAARAEERLKIAKEMQSKWANHRANKGKATPPAAQVIDAATRATMPGAGGMRPPGATAPGVPGAPMDVPDAAADDWHKRQDTLSQRFREQGKGA